MSEYLTVVDTDNLGETETILTLNNQNRVLIDPKELFKNMIENYGGDDLSIFDEMEDFLREERQRCIKEQ